MKNLYRELKNRQQKEMNAFPLGACFSKEQFAGMMQKWGLSVNDTDNIYSIGYGCYIRKCDHAAFHEMLDRHERERKEAIAADKTGNGYIYQMSLPNSPITNTASPTTMKILSTRWGLLWRKSTQTNGFCAACKKPPKNT